MTTTVNPYHDHHGGGGFHDAHARITIIIITVISTITFIIRSAAFSTNHGSC